MANEVNKRGTFSQAMPNRSLKKDDTRVGYSTNTVLTGRLSLADEWKERGCNRLRRGFDNDRNRSTSRPAWEVDAIRHWEGDAFPKHED